MFDKPDCFIQELN